MTGTPRKAKTKANFVRMHPDLSPKELVDRANAEGIKLSTAYVYQVRTYEMVPRAGARMERAATENDSAAEPSASAVSTKGGLSMPKPKSKLTQFIMSLPETMSAAEVIARAEAEGMTTSRSNVSRVRSTFRATPRSSKADFVRGYPNLSANEVVEKAAAAGVTFDMEYVYTVRGYDRRRGKTTRETPTAGAPAMPVVSGDAKSRRIPTGTSRPTAASDEDVLKAIVTVIGLGRALEILAAEKVRVDSVLRRGLADEGSQ
jgi:hypothetical protein